MSKIKWNAIDHDIFYPYLSIGIQDLSPSELDKRKTIKVYLKFKGVTFQLLAEAVEEKD